MNLEAYPKNLITWENVCKNDFIPNNLSSQSKDKACTQSHGLHKTPPPPPPLNSFKYLPIRCHKIVSAPKPAMITLKLNVPVLVLAKYV